MEELEFEEHNMDDAVKARMVARAGGLVFVLVQFWNETRAWPQFAGQMLTVYDRLAYDGPKWTPITDPDD